jgi:hypothetical protein
MMYLWLFVVGILVGNSLGAELAPYSIQYVATGSGDTENACSEVCEAAGSTCYDELYSSMDCQEAAEFLCSNNDDIVYKRMNNYMQCAYGGCFVSCPQNGKTVVIYSDREIKDAKCSRAPTCQHSGQQEKFSQICPCYVPEGYQPVQVDMTEIVGLSFLIIFTVGLIFCCVLYYAFVKR